MIGSTLLDTSFEAELRALVFLFLLDDAADADHLGALDTITVNARTFGMGEDNLNGTHRLASGELCTRTTLMLDALRKLALQGLVKLDDTRVPYSFTITSIGESIVSQMCSSYAQRFFFSALETIEQTSGLNTNELVEIIGSGLSERGV